MLDSRLATHKDSPSSKDLGWWAILNHPSARLCTGALQAKEGLAMDARRHILEALRALTS